MVHDEVDGDQQDQRTQDAHHAGCEALDERLSVEDARDILLACTDRAQDADLLRALEHGDVGDDADHDRRHDEGDAHKADEHIADGVDDRRDAAHEQADVIGEADLIVRIVGVVVVDTVGDAVLIFKAGSVDVDGTRGILVDVAELFEVALIGRAAGGGGDIVVVHVHVLGCG